MSPKIMSDAEKLEVLRRAKVRNDQNPSKKPLDEEGRLLPPWIVSPDIPMGSIGWRMGGSEPYWNRFFVWYRALSASEQIEYQKTYPEQLDPDNSWDGFYKFLKGETPNG